MGYRYRRGFFSLTKFTTFEHSSISQKFSKNIDKKKNKEHMTVYVFICLIKGTVKND